MKYFFTALLLFCVSYSAGLSATPVFVYNHGYVLGELNRVDFIGLNRKTVSGSVSIGNSSLGGGNDFGYETRSDYILQNPWSFCGGRDVYEKLVRHMGEFAVIEYKTPKKSSLLQCQSTNEFVGIQPVSRGTPVDSARESTRINISGQPYGVSVGRIVNAQQSDRHGDYWSVVVQIGNSGNEFRYLQIIDADLYAFALDCLVSATKVKLYHVERIHGPNRIDRSDTYVWRIEAKPGL